MAVSYVPRSVCHPPFRCGLSNPHCDCDFLSYGENFFDGKYIYGPLYTINSCMRANNLAPDDTSEKISLEGIFNETGGDYWTNKNGWMTGPDHCVWNGVSCNDDGFIIEINLRHNNMTGNFQLTRYPS